MTFRSLAWCGVAVILTAGAAQAQNAAEQQVRQAVGLFRDAYLGCKADALRAMLTPDFDAAVAAGTVMAMDPLLKAVGGCMLVDKLTLEPTSVRIYGDHTAVVRMRWSEQPKGKPAMMPYLVTQVYVRQNGKWMLATQQGTTAPAGG